ncbi:long-chain fatty acid--CoA ligase [Ramlibacter henchirensis]|uniref:Long-chain fatty acid--CoA ligase n=2 Tax=Ramlibacter henchirensis TaxID=204072 RepID=A0A4Z0BMG5_9BURK|nr:long-chain fatty acid--CoA ligase [Ramlibacter henchirensis]
MQRLVERLLVFVGQEGCTDAEFDAMAAEVFAFQYEHGETFRRFCQRRGVTPRRVSGWRDIPAVPISGFKETTLSCMSPAECERVFMTSGTTRADVKGRNHHPTIELWDLSMRRNFAQRFMHTRERTPMLTLFPDEKELPNSSLARYLSLAARTFGTQGSRSWVSAKHGLVVDGFCDALKQAVERGESVAVLGATFSFVHLLDAMASRGLAFQLPPGSRLLDTGGYKGQARELPPDDFYDALARAFGVPRNLCINMYGMTELSSQFYDAGNAVVPSVKSGPHWIRTRVLDPLTGRERPPGERGVLAHCDLANFNSAVAILTEDMGVAVDGGFLLLGRVEGAEAKGCSLAVQEFLEAARP